MNWRWSSPCGKTPFEAHQHVARLLIVLRELLDQREGEVQSGQWQMGGLEAQAEEAMRSYLLASEQNRLVVRFWKTDVLVDALGLRAAPWVHEYIAPLVDRIVLGGWNTLVVSRSAASEDFAALASVIASSGLDEPNEICRGGVCLKLVSHGVTGGRVVQRAELSSSDVSVSTHAVVMQSVLQAFEDLQSERESFELNITYAAERLVDGVAFAPSRRLAWVGPNLVDERAAWAVDRAQLSVACASILWSDRPTLRRIASAALIASMAPVDVRGVPLDGAPGLPSGFPNEPMDAADIAAWTTALVMRVPGALPRLHGELVLSDQALRIRFPDQSGHRAPGSLAAELVALPFALHACLDASENQWDDAVNLLAASSTSGHRATAFRLFLAAVAALPSGANIVLRDGSTATVTSPFQEGNLRALSLQDSPGARPLSSGQPGRTTTAKQILRFLGVQTHKIAEPATPAAPKKETARPRRSSRPPSEKPSRTQPPPPKLEIDLDDVFGSSDSS